MMAVCAWCVWVWESGESGKVVEVGRWLMEEGKNGSPIDDLTHGFYMCFRRRNEKKIPLWCDV